MLKVGDKVRVIDNISAHEFNIGEIVKCVKLEQDGIHEFKCNKGSLWYMVGEDYEILPDFKIGDKVRLKVDEETSDYHGVTKQMIEDYDVLTIRSIDNSPYGGDGNYLIKVQENSYYYHSDWLELVEDDQEEMMEDVQEEIGYTTITGVHFGNHVECTWQCDRDLFKDIKLLDLVLVDTVEGEQVVQVVKKSETLDIKGINKKVIKKLEVY